MVQPPLLSRVAREGGGQSDRFGHELLNEFLEFYSGRARRKTLRAYAYDLKASFCVVAKDAVEVTPADVMALLGSPEVEVALVGEMNERGTTTGPPNPAPTVDN